MNENEVTITRTEYLRLLECEKDAEKCSGCGALAQRDRMIETLEKRITNELSGGVHDLQHKIQEIRKLCDVLINFPCKDILSDVAKVFAKGPAKDIINIIERS